MRMSDALKAKRKSALEQIQALVALVQASESKEFSAEQAAEFDRLEKDVERLDGEVERAERAEKLVAKATAAPADTPVGAPQERRPAEVKEKLAGDKKTSLIMAADLFGKLKGMHPLHVLELNGYGRLADEVCDANGLELKSINTLTPSAGGVLLPPAARGELVDLLYPETVFLQGNPERVPMTGGAYEEPYGITGPTAAYVAEGAKKPVSDATFGMITMKAKKLAGIVLITKEARKWLFPQIEGYVNRHLRRALPQAMDVAALLGTGASDSPLGILNRSGIGVYDASTMATNPKAPTLQELDTIASRAMLHMTTRLISLTDRCAWLMDYRTIEFLKNIRIGSGSDGQLAYPEMQGPNPRWKGYRVLSSTNIPSNLGTTTDETILAFVNFDDVLFGEEEDVTISSSTEATIDVSGTLVHLFQQNMFALLAEMQHDFGLRRGASVVRFNKVRWGAP